MGQQENRLVVADTSWAESIPKWLIDAIESERMFNGMANVIKDTEDSFSDAEMVAYLMTASNRAPMSHNHAQIYIYLTGKVMIKHKKFTKDTLPDMMKEALKDGLTGDQEREMNELRSSLLSKRGKVSHPIFDALKMLKGGKF